MGEAIKHSITQDNDGIVLNASNNDEIVSVACNTTKKTLEMCTKEVSITLDSGKKKISFAFFWRSGLVLRRYWELGGG